MARLVVVDDEDQVRRVICRWLTRAGHEVHAAGSGREALEIVARGSVDLVITDINMPEMDGIEVLMALRGTHPTMPVIVMSGGGKVDKEDLLRSALLLSATAAVPKPVELAQLDRAITALLRPPVA